MEFRVSPVDEQVRIADVLSAYDDHNTGGDRLLKNAAR
jgi:hypothetical protein